ncbi:MAG TPA: hypothetical protein VGH79_10670 [Gaiellaceae bacterium]|jgi:hypothetical protein
MLQRSLVVAVVAAFVLGVSACGGGKKSTTTTGSSAATAQWASGVCDAFTQWKTSLQTIKSNLTSGGIPSSSDLRQAERDAENATQTLTRSLEKLGAPVTTGGAQAKSELDNLETSLASSMSAIEDALPKNPTMSDVMSALPTLKTQVTKMANDLSSAAANLKQLDPGGEIEKAFQSSPACSAFVS